MPTSGNIYISNDITITKGTTTTVTLETADTYVTDDIELDITPQAGSFNNVATSGETYTDNTDAQTVIPENGYLYLNKGWFDNTRISLAHIIPDITGSEHDAGVGHILSGYKAYDENGHLITGTLATVNPNFDGGAVTVTPTVTNLNAPTVTLSYNGTFENASSYGVGEFDTSNPPSGSDGTTYLTIDAVGTPANGSVTASATWTRGDVCYNGATTGFVDKPDDTVALGGTSSSSATTSGSSNIVPTVTDNAKKLYIPIVTVVGAGGGVTKSANGSSVTISGDDPTVTIAESGAFTTSVGQGYGVTTAQPAGTDGTDFLKIQISGTSTTETLTADASIAYDRAVVTNDSTKQGAINMASGASLLAATTGTLTHNGTTHTVGATITGTQDYYIPIVELNPDGGGITITDGTAQMSGTDPVIGASATGDFTTASSYGVITSTPQTTSDYLSITPTGSVTSNGTYTGTANITYERAAVTQDGAIAGAIAIANGATILSAITNGSHQQTISSLTVTPTVNPGTTYYIKKTILAAAGGGLSDPANNSITITPSGSFTITPDIGFASTASGATTSDYGIATSASGLTNYVTLDPGATTTGTKTVSASITINRAAVTVSGDPGATTGTGTGLAAANASYSGSGNVGIDAGEVAAGTNWYVPIVTPTASLTASTPIDATVSYAQDAEYYVNGSPQSSVPTGVHIGAQPSDFSSQKYIKIIPGGTETAGSVSVTPKTSIGKGITAGATDVAGTAQTVQVSVTGSVSDNAYIKVYNGSYSVA